MKISSCRGSRALLIELLVRQSKALVLRITSLHRSSFAEVQGEIYSREAIPRHVVESESLLFGTGFGVSTDIQTGPRGGLFVVSSSTGNVYEIHRVRP